MRTQGETIHEYLERGSGSGSGGAGRKPRGKPAAARDRRGDLAAWLRKKGKKDPRGAQLAAKLDACSPREPCASLACPACAEAAQREFAAAIKRFLRAKRQRRRTVVFLSIVPQNCTAPLGGLASFDPANAKRRVQQLLGKAGVGWAIGAWDLSQNEHTSGRYAPFWSWHLHVFADADDLEALKRRLRKAFQKSDAIPVPVLGKAWDGRREARRYLLKHKFDRRIGVDDAKRKSVGTCSGESRGTRKDRLRSAERLELFSYLGRFGPYDRVFMRKAQLRGNPGRLKVIGCG